MTRTISGVNGRLMRLRGRIEGVATSPAPADELLAEIEALIAAFEETEALHVSLALESLGLERGDFGFASAQEELRYVRLAFAADLDRFRRRLGASLDTEAAARLARAETLLRRAPLTSAVDLAVIRSGRAQRRRQLAAV